MNIRFLLILFSIFFVVDHVNSQNNIKTEDAIQTNVRFGSVVNHSPAYWPTVTEPSFAGDFSYSFRPKKGNTFFEKFNYPAIQFKFLYTKFGDEDVFGQEFGGMTMLDFYLVEKQVFELHTLFGFGLAYITKTYAESPINNVIGTHFNFAVNAEIEGLINLNKHLAVVAGGGFQHFSNGHIKLPNLGINYAYGRLGLKMYLHKDYKKEDFQIVPRRYFTQKNVISVNIGASDKNTMFDNIIKPTYCVAYYRRFHTAPHNIILVGSTFEYKSDEYDYKIFGFWNNSDLALVVGEQLIFGAVSINANLGIYLYSKTQASKYTYQRYGFSYELPIKSEKFSLAIGGQIKTHLGSAELLESKITFGF